MHICNSAPVVNMFFRCAAVCNSAPVVNMFLRCAAVNRKPLMNGMERPCICNSLYRHLILINHYYCCCHLTVRYRRPYCIEHLGRDCSE